jgi:hypothetical protein
LVIGHWSIHQNGATLLGGWRCFAFLWTRGFGLHALLCQDVKRAPAVSLFQELSLADQGLQMFFDGVPVRIEVLGQKA